MPCLPAVLLLVQGGVELSRMSRKSLSSQSSKVFVKSRLAARLLEMSRYFRPILAGANLKDRLVACVGMTLSIGMTGALCSLALGRSPYLPLLVAPVGASAVLLFTVPSSPLAQPWPIVGGNVISATIGILVSAMIDDAVLASGVAVAVAVAAMSLTRSLHPPGGAAALTAVLAGSPLASGGYMFPLVPVGVNSVVLVALGWVFHRISRRSYPHVAPATDTKARAESPPRQLQPSFLPTDVDAALDDLGETFDIDRSDIQRLLRRVELRAMSRLRSDPTCAEIMSRETMTIGPEAERQAARRLLLQTGIRTLAVTDASGRLLGTVGLRELAVEARTVEEVMSKPRIARPDTPVIDVAEALTDGGTHAVVIVGQNDEVVGMVTQTDLLAAFSKPVEIRQNDRKVVTPRRPDADVLKVG